MSKKSEKKGVAKIRMPPAPSPATTPRLIELRRETVIKHTENGETKEYIVKFDELKAGDLLGRGQFGTVKKMFHEPSNMTFAVKMISDTAMEANDKRNSEIMDLEVPIKLGDGCPFLIKYYGALHAESYIWILTEVMDTSLDRFYAKAFALDKPLTEPFISKVSFAVVSSLNYMKSLKLMHRDIKPSNILINATGEIKVCDFGISGFTTNSVCSTFKGCQRYMPPEKINPELAKNGYNVKADIWSLGISLIELATGVHPFEGVAFLGLIKRITDDNPSPTLDKAKFSEDLCTFVNKCLFKEADKRSACADLLQEPFILKYSNESIDLTFVDYVVKEVKKDVVEP